MKLVVKNITIRNFLSFGDNPVSLDLDEEIFVLLLGYNYKNSKSNGSGKTNLLIAFMFALYGKTPKNLNKSRLLNWKNKKNCEVSTTFYLGNDKYTFIRGIKPDIFNVYKNDSKLEIEADKTNFQSWLESEIIPDYHTARNFVYFNPNNDISIINSTKEQKRKLLESPFNLHIFSRMNEKSNEKLRNTNKNIEITNKELEYIENSINQFQSEIENKDIPDISFIEQEYSEIKDKFQKLESVNDIDQKMEQIDSDRGVVNLQIEEVNKEINDLKSEIGTFELQRKSKKKELDKIGDIEREKQRYQELLDQQKQLEEVNEEEVSKSEEELNRIKDNLNEINTNISNIKTSINNLPNPNNFENNSNCPTCHSEVDYEKISQYVEQEKQKLESEKDKYEIQKTDVESRKKYLENFIKNKKDDLKNKNEIEKEIAKYSNFKEKIEWKENLENKINEIDRKIEELQPKITEKENHKNSLSKNLDSKEKKYRELQTKKESIKKVESDLKLKKERYNNALKEKEESEKFIEDKKGQIEKKKEEYKEKLNQKRKNESLKKYLNVSKDLLKDENIKKYAISYIIPYFNELANQYLSQVGFDFYLEIDNWMEITVKGPDIKDPSLNNFSGGESKSIDLALKFAMMDIARMQAATYPDILILDEILDSSIDGEGLEEIIKIVKYKKDKDGLKVFIVSHREETKEINEIDKIYHIVKNKEGMSEIK